MEIGGGYGPRRAAGNRSRPAAWSGLYPENTKGPRRMLQGLYDTPQDMPAVSG